MDSSGLRAGGKKVPIKTLKVLDDSGCHRRYRISTVNESSRAITNFAQGRLAKDKTGRVGARITGTYSSFFRVGRRGNLLPSLFVSFNALSKKAQKALLKQIKYELIEEDGAVLAREIKTREG